MTFPVVLLRFHPGYLLSTLRDWGEVKFTGLQSSQQGEARGEDQGNRE